MVIKNVKRLRITSTAESVQLKGFTAMHYAVKSWNELVSANTNKLKPANSLCHRANPKHLEADSATGSWTPRVTAEDQSGD